MPNEPPTTPMFEAVPRVEATNLLVNASGLTFEDAKLIVVMLENAGIFLVREVERTPQPEGVTDGLE